MDLFLFRCFLSPKRWPACFGYLDLLVPFVIPLVVPLVVPLVFPLVFPLLTCVSGQREGEGGGGSNQAS